MYYKQKAKMTKKQMRHVPLLSFYTYAYAHASLLLSQQGWQMPNVCEQVLIETLETQNGLRCSLPCLPNCSI